MKAWVLHNIGDCRREDVAEPVPAAGEVLVEVRAAGICGSDIPRIYRTGAHVHPLIPGHEFSGVVVKAADAQREWLHRRVGVFPLIPCHDCGPCRSRQYEMCRHYDYLGSRRDGGFAEYVAVPADNLIALPDTVSFAEGAMMEPMAVAVHAMRRAALTKADRIVVCGLGTIGLLLVMFLKEAGMEHIFVVGNKAFQRQAAARLGVPADCYCDAGGDVQGWIAERTGGAGQSRPASDRQTGTGGNTESQGRNRSRRAGNGRSTGRAASPHPQAGGTGRLDPAHFGIESGNAGLPR